MDRETYKEDELISKLITLIKGHEDLSDKALLCSKKIYSLAMSRKIDFIPHETENRQRLINILSLVQEKIEKGLQQLPPQHLYQSQFEEISSWYEKFIKKIDQINQMDEEIIRILELDKSATIQEIACLYRQKSSLKGYNLSTVRK